MKKEKIIVGGSPLVDELELKILKVDSIIDAIHAKKRFMLKAAYVIAFLTVGSLASAFGLHFVSSAYSISKTLVYSLIGISAVGFSTIWGMIYPAIFTNIDIEKYEDIRKDLEKKLEEANKENDITLEVAKESIQKLNNNCTLQYGEYYKNIDRKYKHIRHTSDDIDFVKANTNDEPIKTLGSMKK